MPPRSRSRQVGSSEASPTLSPANSPPKRNRSTRRTDLSGMDLGSEKDDEEYSEPQAEPEDEEEVEEEDEADDGEAEMEEDDEVDTPKRKKRDRTAVKIEEKSVEPDAEAVNSEDKTANGEGNETKGEGEEDEEEEEEEEEEEAEATTGGKEKRALPKKRGRKRTKLTLNEDGAYYDEDGNLLNIVNDEVVVEDQDPNGKLKVDEFGNLQGDRQYRNKIFTVLGQGDRKYMVSTEPARSVGFRDSYLLFKTHNLLFKRVCNNEEKMDLIERNIIPNSYKGRSVNLVTARSIYREFGAKVLKDGKKVIDDFWEQRARDNGDKEGEYADPNELYNYNMARNGGFEAPGMSNAGPNQPTPISGAALVGYQNDPTWMYQIATQTREVNNRLLEIRSQSFRGVKDVYTGLTFFPWGTQPTKSVMKKVISNSANDKDMIVDTQFANPNIRQKFTGLSSVPKLIIDSIEDESLKESILGQIDYEKSM